MKQGEAWFSKEKDILFVEEGHECPAGKTELLPEWRTNVVYYGEAFAINTHHHHHLHNKITFSL